MSGSSAMRTASSKFATFSVSASSPTRTWKSSPPATGSGGPKTGSVSAGVVSIRSGSVWTRLSLIAVAKPTVPRLARSAPRRAARTMSDTERPVSSSRPGDQQHDGDDVGPDPVEERAGRPVEDLPQTAAVMREEVGVEEPLAHPLGTEAGRLRRQGEQKPGGDRRHADRDRLRRRQERPQDQPDSREAESDGDNHSARADGIVERRLRAVADGAPVPPQIDDVPQIDRQADAAEAGQVEPALHHLGRGPAAGRPRAPPRPRAAGLRFRPRAGCFLRRGGSRRSGAPKMRSASMRPPDSTPASCPLRARHAASGTDSEPNRVPKTSLKSAWESGFPP